MSSVTSTTGQSLSTQTIFSAHALAPPRTRSHTPAHEPEPSRTRRCPDGLSGQFDEFTEDEAFEELSKRQGDWGLQGSRKHQIMRYENAMNEVQRLGQEIQPEPVAYFHPLKGFYWAKPTSISAPTIADVEPLPLYTTPPQRTWVGLTDEEIKEFDTWHDNREEEVGWCNPSEIVAYIEAKLKEKNT